MATPSTRQRRVRSNAGDITPEMVGRKYVRREDKCLRDVPVGYTPEGKRIYAYDPYGVPICHSKRPGVIDPETGENVRCQSPMTMHNGRCKQHNGKAPSGVLHYNAKHLRTADCLPSHLQGDFNRAMTDPDLLSLNHEIVLVDIEIKQYKEEMGSDIGGAPMAKLKILLERLEGSLEEGSEITEELLASIVKVYHAGKGRDVTNRKMHTAMEMRRKLVDTAHHREKDLKTMIKADQAIALITALAAACKDCVTNVIAAIENRYVVIDRHVLPTLSSDIRTQVQELAVTSIDKSFKLDFLNEIGLKLGQLIGKARETMVGDPSTQTRQGNSLAVIRNDKFIPPKTQIVDD